MKLPNYKKITSGDYASCWYCQKPTYYCLFERDGSEIWCCVNCALKYSNNVKFQRIVRKHQQKGLSLKKNKILCVKNGQVGLLNQSGELKK